MNPPLPTSCCIVCHQNHLCLGCSCYRPQTALLYPADLTRSLFARLHRHQLLLLVLYCITIRAGQKRAPSCLSPASGSTLALLYTISAGCPPSTIQSEPCPWCALALFLPSSYLWSTGRLLDFQKFPLSFPSVNHLLSPIASSLQTGSTSGALVAIPDRPASLATDGLLACESSGSNPQASLYH